MKARLPLSLLFACAVASVGVPAIAADTSSALIIAPDKPTSVFDDKLLSKQWQWYLSKDGVNIVPVWKSGITGSGVVIGIIDEWVEPNHEDLNVSPYNPGNNPYDGEGLSKDFVGSEVIPTDDPETEEDESLGQIYTDENHGTFVAGMAAAIGGNELGVVGAAPGATIAGLHVDLGNFQTILNATYWGTGVSADASGNLAYTNDAAIQVKNCSFGSMFQQGAEADFWKAISDTSKNNVIYVFAAGNSRGEDGYNLPGTTGWDSTGSSPDLINVAASDKDGRYASFSCFGSNVFVTAPGAQVVSTDRTGEIGYNAGGLNASSDSSDDGSDGETKANIANPDYAQSDGTSFSAPLVSGVVALGKQICPVMDVRWAKHALAYSSGGNAAPNIDCIWDEDKKTYVQKSGYKQTIIDEVTGEEEETAGISTGNWVKNAGGLWFNNNYGFGMVDPEGFVEKVRDIAYTTVGTTYQASSVGIVKADETSEATGDIRFADFSVSTAGTDDNGKKYSLLNQRVETVSVTINFSEAARASALDLTSLKVILTDPNGIESVLVQGSAGDQAMQISAAGISSYKFLTNAFWGTAYANPLDWKVRVEYEGLVEGGVPVDMTNWVSVGSVDFTMGEFVNEGNIRISSSVNAHALALDCDSFVVGAGGKFYVEDAVLVNGGIFAVEDGGIVDAYADAALKKGVKFVQYGGNASVAGTANFERGIYLYGGNFNLFTTVTAGSGTFINGGTFFVKSNVDGAEISAGSVTLNGGNLVLEQNSNFGSGVVVNGGTFEARTSSRGRTLSVLGGLAKLNDKTAFGGVSVGQDATETTEEKGGQIVFSGRVSAEGISLKGAATGTVSSGSEVSAQTAVGISGNATLSLVENTKINSSVSVSGNAALAWSGKTGMTGLNVAGGTVVAYGDTVLETASGVVVGNGATFKLGKTTIIGTLQADAGSILEFESRSRADADLLIMKDSASLILGTPESGATPTTLRYDFGNALPYEAEVIRLETANETFSEQNIEAAEAISVVLGEGTPKILTETTEDVFVKNDLVFSLKEKVTDSVASLVLSSTQVFDNLHLYYAQQTELQSAVQMTLLRNQADIPSLLGEFNRLENVSEMLTTYEKLGVPANVVAIDELHDKQANALTGAISRRSRELRSGFIHYDVWSNPLLGNSGFSFSARPNLVAAKGFVPYSVEETDYPLMIWANGGYSFSEADDGAMSVSSTKSSMLNLAMGADYSINENLAAGVFIGYAGGRTKFDDGGRTEIASRNIGVYLTGSKTDNLGGSYYGTAMASFGFEEYDFSRKFSLGALNSSATATPEGWQGILFLEGGYEWKLDKFSMGPSLSVRYVSNNIDGYTESSGDAWMRQEVDDVSYDSLQTSLGWRIAYRADFETVSILPEIRASWHHEFLGADEDFDAKLALPNADSYTCTIADTGDNYMSVGAGLTMMLGDVSTISLDYDMQFMRDDADPVHSVNAMFRTRF